MYALKNPRSGHMFIYKPAETGNDSVKVIYVRERPYKRVGHWRDSERARAHYRTHRRNGWVPAPVPAGEIESYAW